MSKQTKIILCFIAGLLFVGFLTILLNTIYKAPSTQSNKISGTNAVQVVAAENFWGSLASQIGGDHVQVLSIVTDPNADPHEYESNTTDARAVSDANYVIENGAGYDSWMDKLLGAGGNSNRKVTNVADLLSKKEGDNPHFWYNPDYVNQVAQKIESDLIAVDPQNTAYYQQNYITLASALSSYQNTIASIKQQFSGTKVGATEDIFVYLAQAAGLDLTTPPQFIQAVGEGNDPSASSVVTFENQINSKQIKVLVYNVQTDTPVTENIKSLAQKNNIPIVPISETLQPINATFQDWMGSQVNALQAALQKSKKQ